jgi:hypothetical protein
LKTTCSLSFCIIVIFFAPAVFVAHFRIVRAGIFRLFCTFYRPIRTSVFLVLGKKIKGILEGKGDRSISKNVTKKRFMGVPEKEAD